MHTGHKKMECKYCQNTFINSDQLQIHIRQKHTGERPYLCEACSQAFTSSSALFRHKRDVHDQVSIKMNQVDYSFILYFLRKLNVQCVKNYIAVEC